MVIAFVFFFLGVFALTFGVVFSTDPKRLVGRSVLAGKIEYVPSSGKPEISPLEEEMNRILNKVYAIDEALVVFRFAVAMFLYVSGFFMVGTGIFLVTR